MNWLKCSATIGRIEVLINGRFGAMYLSTQKTGFKLEEIQFIGSRACLMVAMTRSWRWVTFVVRCIACDGSGKTSEVIAGVDWVATNLQLPAVLSMSLGADSTDDVLDAAVLAVIALGATVVTASGNFNNGICTKILVHPTDAHLLKSCKDEGVKQFNQSNLKHLKQTIHFCIK